MFLAMLLKISSLLSVMETLKCQSLGNSTQLVMGRRILNPYCVVIAVC